jgi:ABC-type phosphate/phosphonate transport system substrate-binding protein
VRTLQRADSLGIDPLATGLSVSNPWQPATVRRVAQALLGGTWTHQSQLSLLAEAWWDGSALSGADWARWRQRNRLLADLPARGAPAAAAAGNLAWQLSAFSTSPSLRRGNIFVRLSWEHEGWQPTLDVLYTPQDRGRTVTAALLWKGDAVQLQAGLRTYGVLAQLPTRRLTYVAGAWSF